MLDIISVDIRKIQYISTLTKSISFPSEFEFEVPQSTRKQIYNHNTKLTKSK